jgi:hypothetical protein
MDHGAWLMHLEDRTEGGSIADVDLLEAEPGPIRNRPERIEVARVRELVHDDDGTARTREPSHERGADETRAAGDEDRPQRAS